MYKFARYIFLFVFSIIMIGQLERVSAANDDVNQVMVQYSENQELETVEVPENKSVNEVIEQLEKQPNIEYVEPDYTLNRMVTTMIPTDIDYNRQWHHEVIGSEMAWELTTGSEEIVVAIIDDGIDAKHEDLQSQILSTYDRLTKSHTWIPKGEHGTHVAGIIASTLNNGLGGVGVAPNVRLLPINIFNGDEAYISDLIGAINYAIEQDVQIISISLAGGSRSELLNQAIQRAYRAGILIIAASGNDGRSYVNYPASYQNVISVGATDEKDRIASYSNYNAFVDISAPGSRIYSTLPNNRYGFMTGTSMATPVVSGVAALIWSSNPLFTNKEVEKILLNSAVDLGTTGWDQKYGFGRVSAVKALSSTPVFVVTLDVQEVSDRDTQIKGKTSELIQNDTLRIFTNKETIVTAQLVNQRDFSIKIPKQKAGTKLYIMLEQAMIEPLQVTVLDKTPPAKPKVTILGDHSLKVKGTAEKNSTVILERSGKVLGTAKASSAGNYTITLTKKLSAGMKVELKAKDASGNISATNTATVQDKTPPTVPTVNKVTSKTTKLFGKAEAKSTVYVKSGGTIIAKKKVSNNGRYTLNVKKQKKGMYIYVYAIDGAKNKSKSKKVKVQ